MKKILGLDLGTNSIGWAFIEQDFENKKGNIKGIGSRIIPMSQDVLGKFDSGQSISQTADRTGYRGVRRLYQRANLRRERLHRVLNILNFLPEHYKKEIDFENKLGQFKKEVKINYCETEPNKFEFLFKKSYNEMVNEFKEKGINNNFPFDWTLYYLRKKALKEKITKEELAWVILNFNQKRGYYQLRGDELDREGNNKEEKYHLLTVKSVTETDDKNEKGVWYKVSFEEIEAIYKRQSKEPLNNWIGLKKEFIITTSINKDGDIKYSFRAPKEDDWGLIKKKTEQELDEYIKEDYRTRTVGTYIFNVLLNKPNQKIRGKLIKTIEREYYKKELEAILEKQAEFHPELNLTTEIGKKLYNNAINELYRRNENHKSNIKNKGFKYLFVEDIIFYQRPLKSQKNNISGCQYEKMFLKDKQGRIVKDDYGNSISIAVKATSKSHPLFQEFRLWQFLRNLRVYQQEKIVDGRIKIDYDVTEEILKTEDDWVQLFDFLNNRKEINQKQFIDFLAKEKFIEKKEKDNYKWNYVEDKSYPASDTRAQIINRLKKVKGIPEFDNEKIISLWHIIYSVSNKEEYKKALGTFAEKNNIDKESFIIAFEKFPPFKSDYASYSLKAIKKLLPLMCQGKYWNEGDILSEAKKRINNITKRLDSINYEENRLDEIRDDDIQKQVLKSFIKLENKNPYKALNTYQATYAVYDRHSEVSIVEQWNTPDDINKFLQSFKQHSLRNPIVEQVLTETLRTVRDIWKEYGKPDEIHIELGREMKNPAEKRKEITKRNIENENTNYRIREILKELMNEGVENVKDFSPTQQEILKIYEEGVFQNPKASYKNLSEDDVIKIRKNPKPSKNDIIRYKLWLKQGYISPYTGETIPLSDLFTTKYQIEHIIPQSRYFDNSLSNKVICESEVNELKSNQTAYEFIKNHGGETVPIGKKTVKIFELEKYENHCNRYFNNNKSKLKKLLTEDIPENFIERQINDTRYISKLVKGLLSNIVREENEQSETSKNLIPVTGAITSILKQDWGLNDKWNEVILPRFERLNKLTNSNNFTYLNESGKLIPTVPDDLKKGFSKKRIDHRHHALDAIVIACTTRKHIQYLNSLNNEKIKYELQPSLLIKNKQGNFTKHFLHPWQNFSSETKQALETIIISFKQNLRVINKSKNKYWKWVEEGGQVKKLLVKQTKGDNWAIRKPLHKETVSGKINIPTPKGKIATAVRTSLSEIKNNKHLDKITDSGIKTILKNHLKNYITDKGNADFNAAFSPEGIEELNKNIIELNGGKKHQPIYKVRLYETGNKFQLSDNKNINKSKKFVEAAQGTNLYFAIYWDEEKQKREFKTIPLNEVIAHQKLVANLPKDLRAPVPVDNDKQFLFTLSPNDLVYIPSVEEIENPGSVNFRSLTKEQYDRIYIVNDFSSAIYFTPNRLAKQVAPKEVDMSIDNKGKLKGSFDTKTATVNNVQIKDVCWKLTINRLGKITEVNTGKTIIKID